MMTARESVERLLNHWPAADVKVALDALEQEAMNRAYAESHEDRLTLDRLITNQVLKEHQVRTVVNRWMSGVLNEHRNYTVSAENAAALGYYVLMALDHPEELENLKLVIEPYVVEDEDE